MSELVGKIYVTNEYGKFKKLKGNRQLRQNKNLQRSILKSGILIPIEINEKFEILDGQTRFELAKKLELPVPYRIIEGIGIKEVITLNSTTKSWSVMDYVNKYALDHYIDYEHLKELYRYYKKVPISSLASAAEGYLTNNALTTKRIREGNFKFYNFEVFSSFLNDYCLFISKTEIKSGQYTFFAFFNLYTTKEFDYERLANGIIEKIQFINGNTCGDVVLELFLEAHNKGLKDKSALAIKYIINKKEKPEIISSRNTIMLNGEE